MSDICTSGAQPFWISEGRADRAAADICRRPIASTGARRARRCACAKPLPAERRGAVVAMMEVLRSGVNTWECDQMGHMNVRHYFARANQGISVLGLALGLGPSALRER